MKDQILKELNEAKNVIDKFINDDAIINSIEESAKIMTESIENGGKIISCGNGGSMCDAMHFAEELTGKFREERSPIPAVSISDTSHITCVGNDYGFEHVFARELQVIANTKDLFLPISTSGNSKNIIEAVKVAKELKIQSIGLTGNNNSILTSEIKCIKVPSSSTAYVQECHIMIGHFICKFVEEEYF